MSIKIDEDTMTAIVNGKTIASATRTGTQWRVTTWPHPLDHNAAITALSIAERVTTHGEGDPCVAEWHRELARA
ncbi:hypothetical protein [Actinomadura roseirufa]|uniref:hypothetical protein n=1 Tax=Actinomadura roseirufa TaxID=2094049 RepID=UPI0013F17D5F|nr:hypothetical protein [Actinomadura roseirufa]